MIANLLLLPFRLSWNIFIIVLAVSLTIALNVFIWGSVIAGVILLCFAPAFVFIFPMFLIAFAVELWPEYYELTPIDE